MRTVSSGFSVLLCSMTLCSASASAQVDKTLSKEDFLARYREAVPKLEHSLFRNKSIDGVLTTHNPNAPSKEELTWVRKISYRSNSDRFNLSVRIPRPDKTTAYLFRPGQYYSLTRMGDKPFVIESERTFTSAVSDTIIANSFSANDNISLTNGMGHGLLISGMDWYTVFANDTLPIASVVETSYEGRACYKVIAGEIEVAKRTSNVAYFDKNNFMVFLYFYTFNPPGKSPVMCEEIVEYDSKGNDFDSIVIKSYRDYFESKGQNLPRQLSNEHIFTTYKTETHPPEVFRLEQYGLPDVAEQPKGTSRTAVALIAAGVVLGGFLLVAWLRGRRAAKTA